MPKSCSPISEPSLQFPAPAIYNEHVAQGASSYKTRQALHIYLSVAPYNGMSGRANGVSIRAS